MKTSVLRTQVRQDATSALGYLTHQLQQPHTALECALEVGLLGLHKPDEYRALLRGALQEAARAAKIAAQIRDCIAESGCRPTATREWRK